jgi:glycine betaine/proline transport system permease protein
MTKIEIGSVIEKGIEWLSREGEPFFDTITYGIEGLVKGLQSILAFPHPVIFIVILALLAYYIKTGKKKFFSIKGLRTGIGLPVFIVLGMLLLWNLEYWEHTMQTLALVLCSSFISLLIGLPLGIQTARSGRFDQIVRPILDFMQTMPAFVYLIPAILFFSVGNVPGVVATVVFSLPPAVRLTNLGIRGVQEDVIEAARSFGCTKRQLLYKVQIPLAMPTILAGVNQVIMLALSMVVIASMVGAGGLGERVYTGILQAKVGLGFEAGLGIVIIAIILDRMTQSFGTKKIEQK